MAVALRPEPPRTRGQITFAFGHHTQSGCMISREPIPILWVNLDGSQEPPVIEVMAFSEGSGVQRRHVTVPRDEFEEIVGEAMELGLREHLGLSVPTLGFTLTASPEIPTRPSNIETSSEARQNLEAWILGQPFVREVMMEEGMRAARDWLYGLYG